MYDAPIREVSGACFAGDRLVIVGDAEPSVAWAPWHGKPGEWTVMDVAAMPGAPQDTGQFEAVEHVAGDTVLILCEEPARLVAVDLAQARVTGSWHLRVDLKGLSKPWRKDANSHGEGFFLGDDRVYVVKEKKPAAIIEFGPPGESAGEPRPGTWTMPASGELHALAWWDLDLPDVSDVCVDQGVVWLLSDQDRCRQSLTGHRVPVEMDKPEGLTRTPEGTWLVTIDNRDGRDAIWVLDD